MKLKFFDLPSIYKSIARSAVRLSQCSEGGSVRATLVIGFGIEIHLLHRGEEISF